MADRYPTDRYPNADEFGAGAPYSAGFAIGCAIGVTWDLLEAWGKKPPRLADGTPNLISLGRSMGARCRAVNGTQHGLAIGSNDHVGRKWATCCIALELKARGISVIHAKLTWSQIEANLKARRPVFIPGPYGKFNYVSPTSYSSTITAKGRSDGYTGGHMVLGWDVNSAYSTGTPINFRVSDADFGSPGRPRVPPHSVIRRTVLRSFWETYQWMVVVVTTPRPAASVQSVPWWGSDVKEKQPDITRAYTASAVGTKLRSLGITTYGKAINFSDLEAGLRKRGINFGTSVQLIDVRALMKAGTGR